MGRNICTGKENRRLCDELDGGLELTESCIDVVEDLSENAPTPVPNLRGKKGGKGRKKEKRERERKKLKEK